MKKRGAILNFAPGPLQKKLESLRNHYIRRSDGSIEQCTLMEWAHWLEEDPKTSGRLVEFTELPDGSYLSTIFLGIDHNFAFGKDRRPVLFETMYFEKLTAPKRSPILDRDITHDGKYQWRWRLEKEAVRGHKYIATRLIDDPQADLDTYDPLEVKDRGEA